MVTVFRAFVDRPSYFDLLKIISVISHFGFEGGTLVLIASVPGHCLSFTFFFGGGGGGGGGKFHQILPELWHFAF